MPAFQETSRAEAERRRSIEQQRVLQRQRFSHHHGFLHRQRFLQQQTHAVSSTSPQIKTEAGLAEAEGRNLTSSYCPSFPSAPTHHGTRTAQKEKVNPSFGLPFRNVNWDLPPSPGVSLHQQRDTHQCMALKQNTDNRLSYPPPPIPPLPSSFPPPTIRSASFSHPISHVPTQLAVKTKEEEEATKTWPDPPLTARRSSLPNDRTAEGKRLRKQHKQKWKKELELREDKYGAEQESLFSAARENFSPDPTNPPDGCRKY